MLYRACLQLRTLMLKTQEGTLVMSAVMMAFTPRLDSAPRMIPQGMIRYLRASFFVASSVAAEKRRNKRNL